MFYREAARDGTERHKAAWRAAEQVSKRVRGQSKPGTERHGTALRFYAGIHKGIHRIPNGGHTGAKISGVSVLGAKHVESLLAEAARSLRTPPDSPFAQIKRTMSDAATPKHHLKNPVELTVALLSEKVVACATPQSRRCENY